jgi:hypothetical protein
MNNVHSIATIRRSMSAELPYDETRDPRWAATVDEMDWVRSSDETVCKQGPCPRCDHDVTFVDQPRPQAEDREEAEQRMFEECNCGVVHPGTPEGRIGCGANGLIQRSQS